MLSALKMCVCGGAEESRITYTLAPGAKNCNFDNIRSFIYNEHKINKAFFLHVHAYDA